MKIAVVWKDMRTYKNKGYRQNSTQLIAVSPRGYVELGYDKFRYLINPAKTAGVEVKT